MRRPLKRSSPKLSADSQRLVALAQAILQASSRLEERAWEKELDILVERLLRTHHQETVDAATEHAFKAQTATYDVLTECIEAVSESCQIEHEGQCYDALLVALPVLTWTRFAIPSGAIPQECSDAMAEELQSIIAAPNVSLAIAPILYSIDQLPRTHAETFALTHQLVQSALKKTPFRPRANLPETIPFLADVRFLLAAFVVKSSEPLFRWQLETSTILREQALSRWKAQAGPHIERLLPGCGVDLLLPEGYFFACREADRQIRPHSIRAAVHYLTNTLNVGPSGLHAVIGGFGEDAYNGQIDEYRISFTVRHEEEMFYGVVWPLYGQEDEEQSDTAAASVSGAIGLEEAEPTSPVEEIIALLKESGIVHIKRHGGCFPMESCEDCGAPLYLDLSGELVHVDMPEDAPQGTTHFH